MNFKVFGNISKLKLVRKLRNKMVKFYTKEDLISKPWSPLRFPLFKFDESEFENE